jgi:hypothetical protein
MPGFQPQHCQWDQPAARTRPVRRNAHGSAPDLLVETGKAAGCQMKEGRQGFAVGILPLAERKIAGARKEGGRSQAEKSSGLHRGSGQKSNWTTIFWELRRGSTCRPQISNNG